MQQFLLKVLLGSCFVVMLTCSAGVLLAAPHQRDDLILPSATKVWIEGAKDSTAVSAMLFRRARHWPD